MTEKPFIHKKAFTNVKLNFLFHDELAKILCKVIGKKGIRTEYPKYTQNISQKLK